MRYTGMNRPILAATAMVFTLLAAQALEAQMIIRGNVKGVAPAQPGKDALGIHLPRDKQVNMTPLLLTDGGKFRWDIHQNGNLGSCTDNAYSGGMNIQINNAGFGSPGQGFMNKAGDEVEIGPYNVGNVRFSRRIKVYQDIPLARWLNIFENPTAQEITVNMACYSHFSWQLNGFKTNSGQNTFEEQDYAMVTHVQGGMPNVPLLLHVVCGKKSKVRPTIQVQNNSFWVRYSFTIPPNGTAVIAMFESQGRSMDDHMKFLETLKPAKLLKDLPSSARKLVINFASTGHAGNIELERNEAHDSVVLASGDPMFGTITNESFAVATIFGEVVLPAKNVIGMGVRDSGLGTVAFVLADGQTIVGKADIKLDLTLSTGGKMNIPLKDIAHWSYRISQAKPEESPATGPTAALRTGDLLILDPKGLKLPFITRYGRIDLQAENLLDIAMVNQGNGVHRAQFVNGSSLGGFLDSQDVALPAVMAPKLQVPRDMIMRLTFGSTETIDPSLSKIVLANDDELCGRVITEGLNLNTEFNPQQIQMGEIKSMIFSKAQPDRAVLTQWNGTVIRGQLEQKELAFQVVPGPLMNIDIAQVVSLAQFQSVPAQEILKQVDALVARLGAESFKDRHDATQTLMKLSSQDPRVPGYLKGFLKDNDPEVRQRITSVIEKSGGTVEAKDGQPMPLIMIEDQEQ